MPGSVPPTIVDVLQHHAATRGDKQAIGYLERGERLVETATYAELDEAARRVAAGLISLGAEGRPVLMPMSSGLGTVKGFLGCLYAGALAVPVPPQWQMRGRNRSAAIAANANARLALAADPDDADKLQAVTAETGLPMQVVATSDLLEAEPLERTAGPAADRIAFIQYTSGSTSHPKGIAVTHANIMANEAMIAEAFGNKDDSVVVLSWLPLHHDMGLIGSVLQPLYMGGRCYLMSSLSFLQKPLRWLAAMDRYRATKSGAPNFAYDLCVRRIGEEAAAGLDLSAWSLAFCGSEQVRPDVMQRFAERFAPSGFKASALYPCYGLAEATLFVTGCGFDTGVRQRRFGRSDIGGVSAGTVSTRDMVACGHAWKDCRIAIVDPATGQEVPDSGVGEICVSGSHVTPGYWHAGTGDVRPAPGQRIEIGGTAYLRTGDLGVVADGDLYVVGRIKDMIIVRGTNIYAEDVEDTVLSAQLPAPVSAAAAFAVETGEAEELVIVCEAGREVCARSDLAGLLAAIRKTVADNHGVTPVDVVLAPRGAIDRTTSGKVRRGATREHYVGRQLKQVAALREAPSTAPAAVRPAAPQAAT